MRKISATMATQHPDNATAPFWDSSGSPFIGVHKELTDCMSCFRDLGIKEFMWDWEGKYADGAVVDKMFSNFHAYFSQAKLGRDKFLTFRIPNIWEEKGYSLMQAMAAILTSEDFARDLHFPARPLFEVILPMTESADQLMQMHEAFEKLARFKSSEFDVASAPNTDYLEIIPLVESATGQTNIKLLLEKYVDLHQAHFGRKPEYIRPFLARSDPALVAGMLATVLSGRVALSQVYEFAGEQNLPVFPIAGVGGLPFRGGLTPDTVGQFATAHPGMRTVSLQSSFRFDHPLPHVKAAIRQLENLLPNTKPHIIPPATQIRLEDICRRTTDYYQASIHALAGDLAGIFGAVPKRRERRQHIGLLAYGRQMGTSPLPRAITFTAGFYSIGVPPEFIGIGRALADLSSSELGLIDTEYPFLKSDLDRAGRYLNTDNLAVLAGRNHAWKQIQTDIALTEKILGITFGPRTHAEKAHRNLTSNALLFKNNRVSLTNLIAETAILRNSVG